MNQGVRLTLFFAGAGLISGAMCTVALWVLFHGPNYIHMVVGAYSPRILFAFPFIAAVLAGACARFFDAKHFGALQGAWVAAMALVGFCTLLAALHGSGLSELGALILAAFAFFGWALVPLGAALGWWYRRSSRVAL